MFLHRCCFLTEDDMSAPSFDVSLSTMSRASMAGHELQSYFDKEIVYIKRSPKVWFDPEDELCTSDENSTWNNVVGTSSRIDSASTTKTSKDEKNTFNACCSCSTKLAGSNDIIKNKITAVRRGKRSLEQKNKSSTYIFRMPRAVSSSTSRVLDWVMLCCWRCSPGCQQLPALNV